MACKVCGRKTSSGSSLCAYHQGALDSLKKGYQAWNEAYAGITWAEYLNRVKTLEDTGQWIKEVIVLEERGEVD